MTANESANRILHDVIKIMDTNMSYESCITAAIVTGNSLWGNMTTHEFMLLTKLAANITSLMTESDEPRFTLYDYLDAVINHRDTPWPTIAMELNMLCENSEDGRRKAMEDLITMAEQKRKTYEGDI